ncbi:MAG: hypothetical protein H6922_02340 [Pseudomonadaceae bacterium]|nr:hypothetical protein [Pseudomonadaceae bacterium]
MTTTFFRRSLLNLSLAALVALGGCSEYYQDEVRAPTEQEIEDARNTIKPASALREGVFHMQRVQQGSSVRVKDDVKLKKPDLPPFDVAYIGRDLEGVVLELANAAGESVVIPTGLRGRTVTLVHSGADFPEMLGLVLAKAGYSYNYVNGVWYITRYPVRNYIVEVAQGGRKGTLKSSAELSPELAAGTSSSGGGELDTDYSDQFWGEVKETLTELVKIGDTTPGNVALKATGVTTTGQLVTGDDSAVSVAGGLLPPPEKSAKTRDDQLFASVTGVETNTLTIETPASTDHQVPEENAKPWYKITESAGLITVRGSPEAHRAIENYLEQVQESAQRQVVVEARIVALIRDKTSDRGADVSASIRGLTNTYLNKVGFFAQDRITAGAVTGGFFTLGSANNDISLVMQSLSTLGDVYTISSPSLVARNNQMSRVSVTRQLGYVETEVDQNTTSTGDVVIASRQDKARFKNSGTVVSVLPFIGKSKVQVRFRLSVASKAGDTTVRTSVGSSDAVTNLVPELANNVIDQDLILEFGRVYAIGGLVENNTTVNASYEPMLREIPGVGEVFQRAKNRGLDTEFLVLLKVSRA